MIVLDVEQGSAEWLAARIGIPTASGFSEILTPKKLQYAAGAAKYRARILAEWTQGYPIQDDMQSGWMIRGADLEPEARRWYELEKDVAVEQIGFVLREDRRVGGSPDGFVGDDGGAEIKVPALHTHLLYLLDPATLVDEYRAQVQGYMYLTGRHWWDIVSYSPVLPKVVERVERDQQFLTQLHRALGRFLHELDAAKRKLLQMGCNPPAWVERPADEQPHEALIDQMYGPEPVNDEPMPATEQEKLGLMQLRSIADGLLSVEERQSVAYALRSGDGHAVKLWTSVLQKRIREKVPA